MNKGGCHADPACGRNICCFLLKNKQKQIPRSARDDMVGPFSSAYWTQQFWVAYTMRRARFAVLKGRRHREMRDVCATRADKCGQVWRRDIVQPINGHYANSVYRCIHFRFRWCKPPIRSYPLSCFRMNHRRSIAVSGVPTASENCSSVRFMGLLRASRLPGEAWHCDCFTCAGAWSEPNEQCIADRKAGRTLTISFRPGTTYHRLTSYG